MSMKISVIIPSYKPGSYIYKCLNSIFIQTLDHSKFEVLIILNGCNNPYYDEILDFINLRKPSGLFVNLLQTDTPGVSNARNIGIEESNGDFITFIDDDDWISPSYLHELYDQASPGCVVISNTIAYNDQYKILDENYELRKQFYSLQGKKLTINNTRKFFGGPVRKLIHKKIISEFRFDSKYSNGEDSLFMFLISRNINGIYQTGASAVYYRRFRSGSAFTSKKKFTYILINRLSLIIDYTRIYIKNITCYNLIFYCTRVLASLKEILLFSKR